MNHNEDKGSGPDRKMTEELSAKTPQGQRGERRTEYPGYYLISGEYSQEENDRKTSRFNNKNKTLLDEATNNLKEALNFFGK